MRQPAASDTATRAFLAHVEQHAGAYFREFRAVPVTVALVDRRRRRRSYLYVLRLQSADRRAGILIKVSDPVRRFAGAPDDGSFLLQARPYLSTAVDPDQLPVLEHRGLSLVHDHLSSVGDARFGSIRPLDYLPSQRAVIMEYVSEPTLRDVMARGTRLNVMQSADRLAPAFANAGAWLRMYNELPYGETRAVRHGTRDEFIEMIAIFARYLAKASDEEAFFAGITESVKRAAAAALPDEVPLGLSHGDYAARNMFVGDGARITAFDALPRWRAPIYEDLARFIVGMRSVGLQVVTMGLAYEPARLERFEASFVKGYFAADDPPRQSLWLYQVLMLLDKWSALLARSRPRHLRWRVEMAARMRLTQRHFRAEAERLIGMLETEK